MEARHLVSIPLILLSLIAPDMALRLDLAIFLIGTGTLGMLHGALDHHVAFKVDAGGWPRFLAGYLGVMVAYGLVWWMLPWLGLILFLGLTVWHFGQGDTAHLSSRTPRLVAVTRSLAVLGVLFGVNLDEALAIVSPVLMVAVPAWLGLAAAVGGLALHVATVLRTTDAPFRELFDVAWLAVLFIQVPLLTGFTAYFVLWHSAGHLRELQSFLELPSLWDVIKKGIPMTVVALAGIVVFWFWIGSSLLPSHWILYGFVAISLLTLPHMILVDRMLTYPAHSLRNHK
jgi:Brp/Blh family beta-carotene 15,15'-monooxygenase